MKKLVRSVRKLGQKVINVPVIKRTLIEVPIVGSKLYPNWERKHPFDVTFGVDTSGYVPVEAIHADRQMTAKISPYGASQASIIRTALSSLGPVEEYTFVDIGCGKGRAMIVGGEFPFRSVVGVDLSADLVAIARKNAAIVAQKFPQRPKIEVVQANAVEHVYPAGKLVLYTYHPFGRELVAQLISKLEQGLASGHYSRLFFIYYNPVNGDLLDASPHFLRWYAQKLPYDASELGYGPDTSDTVVIWQSQAGAVPGPHDHADRPIRVIDPMWRAEVAG